MSEKKMEIMDILRQDLEAEELKLSQLKADHEKILATGQELQQNLQRNELEGLRVETKLVYIRRLLKKVNS